MTPPRRLAALAAGALALVLGLGGCNNSCYQLAQQVCVCQPTPTAISACNNNIALQQSNAHFTTEDLARCSAELEICDCRSLQSGTLAAKVNCGLARANPADPAQNP